MSNKKGALRILPKLPEGLVLKNGRPSLEEFAYLEKMAKTMSLDQLCIEMRRAPKIVIGMCEKLKIKIPDAEKKIYELTNKLSPQQIALKKSHDWPMLEEEFTKDELDYFLKQYGVITAQFDADQGIMPTEQSQILQVIKMDILMHRNLAATQKAADELKDLYRQKHRLIGQIEDDRAQDPPLDTTASSALLAQVLASITAINQSVGARNKDLMTLRTAHAELLSSLKATREQRVSKIENSKVNFIGLLKILEEEDWRKKEGRELELMKAATTKEKKRLEQYHTYTDGKLDRPFLTPESVLLEDSEDGKS